MNLFQQPRPRRFNHKYIYVDERKERLKKIEQQAREKLGLTPHKPLDREQIHQAFSCRNASPLKEEEALQWYKPTHSSCSSTISLGIVLF